MGAVSLRPLTPDDLDLVCRHRSRMFLDAGRPDAAVSAMEAPFRTWLAPRLADGRYFGFMATDAGDVIGGVGLIELDWPPHPAHPLDDRRGYILNVYVEPDRRGAGVARALMEAGQADLARRGLTYLTLHATAQGRPLYERLGWISTTEMALALRTEEPRPD